MANLSHIAKGHVHILEVEGLAAQSAAVLDELRRLQACDPDFTWDRCAVLSPLHALLDPIRTVLERSGIPIRRRVDPLRSYSLFRLREVQAFLGDLDALPDSEVDAAGLRKLLSTLRQRHPREPHFDLVAETAAAFFESHGEHAHPKTAVRDFFGEVLLEQRRERAIGAGVMLSTVHGSKGAEFDHVILLDGGWQLRGLDSWEQKRRLYYVGMTRARETLALIQCRHGGASWVPDFEGEVFHRTQTEASSANEPKPRLSYHLLSQADINLSFAGREADHQAIERTLEGLATGDDLVFKATDSGVFLVAANGVRVGALAHAAAPRWRKLISRVLTVHIAAVLIRRRTDEGADYQKSLRRDTWQVVVPEITVNLDAVDPA